MPAASCRPRSTACESRARSAHDDLGLLSRRRDETQRRLLGLGAFVAEAFDADAQIVRAVGRAQRLGVGDLARGREVEQRAVERLATFARALLHCVLELLD